MIVPGQSNQANIRYLKKRELCRKRGGLGLQRLHLPLQLTGVPDLPLLGPRRGLPVRQDPAHRGPRRNFTRKLLHLTSSTRNSTRDKDTDLES